jgi:hypothetical protein
MHCHGGDRGFAHSDDLDDVKGHLPVLRNTPQLASQAPKLISLFPMKFAIYPFQGVSSLAAWAKSKGLDSIARAASRSRGTASPPLPLQSSLLPCNLMSSVPDYLLIETGIMVAP